MSTARQQRDAARAKLEARMAEKTARAKRNRRIQITLASALAVVLVAGVGFFFYKVISSATAGDDTAAAEDDTSTDENMVPAEDGSPVEDVVINSMTLSEPADGSAGTASCEYPAIPDEQLAQNPNAQDVGTPGDGDKPNTGTQTMTLDTSQGKIVAELDNAKAPCTAASFTYLAGEKFFDSSKCHRLTTSGIFVLQCGDPSGTGQGGPTYNFANEYAPKDTGKDLSQEDLQAGKADPNYKAGSIAMANSGADTNGSQFFIVYEDTYLPSDYTLFGELSEGLDVVQKIAEAGAEVPADQQQMPMG